MEIVIAKEDIKFRKYIVCIVEQKVETPPISGGIFTNKHQPIVDL